MRPSHLYPHAVAACGNARVCSHPTPALDLQKPHAVAQQATFLQKVLWGMKWMHSCSNIKPVSKQFYALFLVPCRVLSILRALNNATNLRQDRVTPAMITDVFTAVGGVYQRMRLHSR